MHTILYNMYAYTHLHILIRLHTYIHTYMHTQAAKVPMLCVVQHKLFKSAVLG